MMHRALIRIAGSIARAHDRWRAKLGRRPLSGEVSRLQERVSRMEAEDELLRRRLFLDVNYTAAPRVLPEGRDA